MQNYDVLIYVYHDKFDATAETWGKNHSIKKAQEKIEKLIRRKKKIKKQLDR